MMGQKNVTTWKFLFKDTLQTVWLILGLSVGEEVMVKTGYSESQNVNNQQEVTMNLKLLIKKETFIDCEINLFQL